MRQQDAALLARSLMAQHGLTGWTFGWSRAKTICGQTIYSRHTIELSAYYVAHNGEAQIKNTILHEIAHALVGTGHGHDSVWQWKAREIGCDGKRCSAAEMPKGEWQPVCPQGCATTTRFHRAPLRVRACNRHGGTFRPEHVTKWAKGGVIVPLGSMPQRYRNEAMSLRAKYGNRLAI